MANLDSTNKRRSATGIFHLFTIPWDPDGVESSVKREQATYIYGGISAGAPASATAITLQGVNLITGKFVIIKGTYI